MLPPPQEVDVVLGTLVGGFGGNDNFCLIEEASLVLVASVVDVS